MKKNHLLAGIFFTLLCGTILFSCKKDDSNPTTPDVNIENVYDPAAMVSSSISAFVTDENDAPVSGAIVSVGTGSSTTDSRGFTRSLNVQVVKNAGVITVAKAGYFNAIKTWIAEDGKAAFVRIKLLPKTSAGTVSGTAGGTVTLTGGMKILFPANATVNASTSAAYTGTVTVYAKWLNPVATDIASIMPGDLRGLDAAGKLKILTTYGMSAVELRGSANELLQIAPGKKATMTMPIPVSMQGNAPATLPLWYFDETKGLWKEEGTATKTGTDYVGDMSHFSYWNYDAPANYVQFNVTIVDPGGNPIPNVLVRLTAASGSIGYGYTNSNGYTSGAIPLNTQFTFEVLASASCQVLYTTTFSSSTTNISLPTISLLSNRTVRIYGNVTTCTTGTPVNGLVVASGPNGGLSVPVDNATGAYSISIPVCSGTGAVNISVVALDPANNVQGNAIVNSYLPGSSNNLSLQACGTATGSEYFIYNFNGTAPVYYFTPADSIKSTGGGTASVPPHYTVKAQRIPNTSRVSILQFDAATPTVGQSYPVTFFDDNQTTTAGATTFSMTVTLTEVGAVTTGYLAGTYSGTVQMSTLTFPVSGSFRIKRAY